MTYWLLSGHAWLACSVILVILATLDATGLVASLPRALRVIRFASLLAVGIAALSGTPLPWWLAIPVVAATIAYLARPRRITAVVAAIAAIAAFAHEARYFFLPPLLQRPVKRLIIVGDSLATGGFGEERPWSNRISQDLSLRMKNLAQPSETTKRALETQAPYIKGPDATVLIELGGNDLLGDASFREYAANLDKLLAIARAENRQVIMLELPIPPGKWLYGAAQRRLAKKHDVALIPKRVLTRVLLGEGNVVDGLHLTQKGHDAMADELVVWLPKK